MNTPELLQIYTYIETKTIQLQLSQSVYFDLFLENLKGRICTMMSSIFFFAVKQRLLFDKLEKTKELLFTVFREKNI